MVPRSHWPTGRWPGRLAVAAVVSALVVVSGGCAGAGRVARPPHGDCPVAPISVVVSVAQWGDIVSDLAGDCADVTTVVEGSTGDPHEFEPGPADLAAFDGADLVVVNGLGYDTWASDAVAAVSERSPVLDAGKIAGRKLGDNPHLWYDPTVVHQVAVAVTAALQRRSPKAADYFAARAAEWDQAMAPYDAEIERLHVSARGTTYGATEPVFDPMAAALGLTDVTPAGYRRAAANESEPAASDLAAFESKLRNGSIRVLVVNAQTQGAVPGQLRAVAESAAVPVVDVTETIPDGSSFVQWQLQQLRSISSALGQ